MVMIIIIVPNLNQHVYITNISNVLFLLNILFPLLPCHPGGGGRDSFPSENTSSKGYTMLNTATRLCLLKS